MSLKAVCDNCNKVIDQTPIGIVIWVSKMIIRPTDFNEDSPTSTGKDLHFLLKTKIDYY